MPRGRRHNITPLGKRILNELDAHGIGATFMPGSIRKREIEKRDGEPCPIEMPDEIIICGNDDINTLLRILRGYRRAH
jgi:hypothetical protein